MKIPYHTAIPGKAYFWREHNHWHVKIVAPDWVIVEFGEEITEEGREKLTAYNIGEKTDGKGEFPAHYASIEITSTP